MRAVIAGLATMREKLTIGAARIDERIREHDERAVRPTAPATERTCGVFQASAAWSPMIRVVV
ncbi:MAG TPA: hypothetical protein VGC41_27950, partial [Kofleriaceae bacterium]